MVFAATGRKLKVNPATSDVAAGFSVTTAALTTPVSTA
jgi:hypothetical protein